MSQCNRELHASDDSIFFCILTIHHEGAHCASTQRDDTGLFKMAVRNQPQGKYQAWAEQKQWP